MSASDCQAAYSAAVARAALEQEFQKRDMTPAQFYARLGASGVGASVKIVDGNEAGVVSNRFSDGWRDYRFEGDHLVYYAQDADGTTAHRVIVTQARTHLRGKAVTSLVSISNMRRWLIRRRRPSRPASTSMMETRSAR